MGSASRRSGRTRHHRSSELLPGVIAGSLWAPFPGLPGGDRIYSIGIQGLWIESLGTDGLRTWPVPPGKAPLSPATAEFGARVRRHRLELGLTQEALADLCDLHWTYIGQVERGQRNISLHNILRIASAVRVDPGMLVKGLRRGGAEIRGGRQP